jgi:hypothetical protein
MTLSALSLLATGGLLSGPFLFARSFGDLRKRRLMQNTPTARIRSMAMGLVEINGIAGARSTVRAPFSGRECAYWELDIATKGRRDSWSIVHRNSSGQPFFLRDDSGVALVYPHGAECRVRFGTEEVCTGLTLPDCYAQYMDTEQLAMRHMWRMGAMRFRERTLEDGQRVYVLGTAMPRTRAVDISDDEVLAATGTEDLAAQRRHALDDEIAAVVRRGESEKTFIISQESERELSLELGMRALMGVVGGPVFTLFGLGYWLVALSTFTHR